MKRSHVDVAVIGAGVAGLAAARELRRSDPGLEVVVLEARGRIGGRICTVRDPEVAVPIELGAEFLHGTAPETVAVAEDAGLKLCDVTGDRWEARHGRLTPLRDFRRRLDLVMRRLDPARTPDRSFRAFIETRPGGHRLARARTLALAFVEGFHAADADRISERAVAEGGSPGEDPNELRMTRVLDGYDQVPEALAAAARDVVQLNSVVTRVSWKCGEASLTVAGARGEDQSTIRARAAIITVPLGVLLASASEQGAITFDPPPGRILEHARGLTMGSVVRITLHLRERFWENAELVPVQKGKSLNALSFLHSRDADVPVWWTGYPLRAPIIVGWAGGPRAARVLAHSRADVEQCALNALARQVGISTRKMRGLVVGSWLHDWDRDPFARGAYSYAVVGGAGAWSRLARPIEKTLFFAGEAANPEGRLGTVNGAIATGVRAARLCSRALGLAASR